jgi:hypothetical protein
VSCESLESLGTVQLLTVLLCQRADVPLQSRDVLVDRPSALHASQLRRLRRCITVCSSRCMMGPCTSPT